MPNERNPRPKSRAASTPRSDTAEHTDAVRHELQRQRIAWRRRPWLDCDCCSESCRCDYREHPTTKRVDAYRQAIEHLAQHKLGAAALTAECRELWRRGGSDRTVAETIVRRWSA